MKVVVSVSKTYKHRGKDIVHREKTKKYWHIFYYEYDEINEEYVTHFDADIRGVTGDIEQLKILTAALGIFFEKSTDSGEDYNVAHSAVVLLINPQAEFQALFSAPHEVEHFVNDVPLLTGST